MHLLLCLIYFIKTKVLPLCIQLLSNITVFKIHARYFHLIWKTALCRNVCWQVIKRPYIPGKTKSMHPQYCNLCRLERQTDHLFPSTVTPGTSSLEPDPLLTLQSCLLPPVTSISASLPKSLPQWHCNGVIKRGANPAMLSLPHCAYLWK